MVDSLFWNRFQSFLGHRSVHQEKDMKPYINVQAIGWIHHLLDKRGEVC